MSLLQTCLFFAVILSLGPSLVFRHVPVKELKILNKSPKAISYFFMSFILFQFPLRLPHSTNRLPLLTRRTWNCLASLLVFHRPISFGRYEYFLQKKKYVNCSQSAQSHRWDKWQQSWRKSLALNRAKLLGNIASMCVGKGEPYIRSPLRITGFSWSPWTRHTGSQWGMPMPCRCLPQKGWTHDHKKNC